MTKDWPTLVYVSLMAATGWALGGRMAAQPGPAAVSSPLVAITVDYPLEGSVFPPEIGPPTFLWRDAGEHVTRWQIDVAFGDGSLAIHAESLGEPMRIGEIDPRCVSPANELPKLTPEQASAHTWIPSAETWDAIKKHSVTVGATITVTGLGENHAAVSSGHVTIRTSRDPVGAPIFYRDVPLMPAGTQPLAPDKVSLVQWRLRDISALQSRIILKDMPTCANCHSFSRDGKTMGMDMDGPLNNKGLYAIVPVKSEITIRNTDVIEWNTSRDSEVPLTRVGFLSQVSPNGKYVVTTMHAAGGTFLSNYYNANFKDYRFAQVFFPVRGILGWYNVETRQRGSLPGADDPRYVQTDAVWSPDGKYIVFARAEATNPYPPGGQRAEYANDPHEVQIQYDLYRIPFNDGRGGVAEPIAGASANGMSNTFPKISPDGRWIVFVKCRNGQLLRPDSQLYIVPADGGEARRMHCNTSLMNSWHSFSPNGRWLVFSSKIRTAYTQMFLTHIDEEGNDSPAILIDNSTAANRAVNLPEFVNIPPDGLERISAPAVDIYNKFEHARELLKQNQNGAAAAEFAALANENPDDFRIPLNLGIALNELGRYNEAVVQFKRSLQIYPYSAMTYNNLGFALASVGKFDDAIGQFKKALELDPELAKAHNNLGNALAARGQMDEAEAHFEKAVELNPELAEAYDNLGKLHMSEGKIERSIPEFQKSVELNPSLAETHGDFGNALVAQGRIDEATQQFEKAVELKPDSAETQNNLGNVLASQGQFAQALPHLQKAVELNPESADAQNNIGKVLVAEGNLDQAIAYFQKAIDVNPSSADAQNNLGNALATEGRFDQAVPHLQKVVELRPDSAEAHCNLGTIMYYGHEGVQKALAEWREALRLDPNFAPAMIVAAHALATSPETSDRNGPEAVTLAERAVQVSGSPNPLYLDTLAAAYAEVGRYSDAIETERRALELARQDKQTALVETLDAHMKLYQAQQPYREAIDASQ